MLRCGKKYLFPDPPRGNMIITIDNEDPPLVGGYMQFDEEIEPADQKQAVVTAFVTSIGLNLLLG